MQPNLNSSNTAEIVDTFNSVYLNWLRWNEFEQRIKFRKISERLKKFSKDRNWEQYHSPKNLAMALSVEVAELVEIFQWSNDGGTKEIKDPETRKQIEEEIADIFNYLVKFVDLMEIDLEKISLEKIQKNDEKYPVEKSKGKSEKYNKL